jgi:CRISPR-associated protein Csx16
MTNYFVSRHPGAVDWSRRHRIDAKAVTHLDVAQIFAGDTVIGTLPIHLAASVCAKGARYLHLTMDLPEEARGRALDADEMDAFGARIEEFYVRKID